MARSTALAASLLMSIGILAGCGLVQQNYRYRFRLTVEVNTPAGIKVGSGVIQTTLVKAPIWSLGPQTEVAVKGEAVPVELTGGQTLFALLGKPADGDYAAALPLIVFRDLIQKPEFKSSGRLYYDVDRQHAYLTRLKPNAVLSGDTLPLIVRFRDIRDRTSVEAVPPERFSQILGPGFSLRRVTIAITDEPITTGLDRYLPWLKSWREDGGTLDGSEFITSNELKSSLGYLAFRNGG